MSRKDYTEAELRTEIASTIRSFSLFFEWGGDTANESLSEMAAIIAWMADCLCGEELMCQKKEEFKLAHERTLQGLCWKCGVPIEGDRKLCEVHGEELTQSFNKIIDRFDELRKKLLEKHPGKTDKLQ